MIIPYGAYRATAPVIPEIYWDVYSSEQRIKEICKHLKQVIEYANYLGIQLSEAQDAIDTLEDILNRLKNGEYVDAYIDALAEYIDKNLIGFVARLVKYVFPSLYWDGNCWRYELYVPSDWNFLKFKWVWVESDYSYHITLNFVDYNVQADQNEIEKLTRDVENIKSVLNNLIGNISAKDLISLQNSINYIIGYEQRLG